MYIYTVLGITFINGNTYIFIGRKNYDERKWKVRMFLWDRWSIKGEFYKYS